MTPPAVEEVRAALEAATNRAVASLSRFSRGAQSVNYAGVWGDGARFALKLVPFARAAQYARLVGHFDRLASTSGSLAVKEWTPAPGAAPTRFDVGAFHAVVTVWCEGAVVPFDRLDRLDRFVAGYEAFAAAIQDVRDAVPAFDYAAVLARVRASSLSPLVPASVTDATFRPLARGRRTIHGDWQPDNVRFRGGEIGGVLDLEEFRFGRPVEDFARYAACSAGHLRFYSAFARRRVFRSARALAALVPYTPEEWSAAVWGQYLQVIWKSLFKGRTSVAGRVRLAWRLRFFGKLEDAFRAGASQRKGAGDE